MKVRVLVVDDSFFMRKLIRKILESSPRIEVVAEAKDGAEAVELALRHKPQVVTMDYRMPVLTGAEAAAKILSVVEPPPAIVMLSAYTKKGAQETLDSLRAGAVDFVTKPSGEVSVSIEAIQEELILKVLTASRARVIRRPATQRVSKPSRRERREPDDVKNVVVIGASTGGPSLLEDLLKELPDTVLGAFLIVQHMPEHFTTSFAARLDAACSLRVKEAEDGDRLKNGWVLVARGGLDMVVERQASGLAGRSVIRLIRESASQHSFSPSIDSTMVSAAAQFGRGTVGVILTGMGNDGREGMRAIKAVNGHTLVQDPATAAVEAMPQAVIEAGLADEVLTPERIIRRIVELV